MAEALPGKMTGADHNEHSTQDDASSLAMHSDSHTDTELRTTTDQEVDRAQHEGGETVAGADAPSCDPDSNKDPITSKHATANGHEAACSPREPHLRFSLQFHCPKCEESICDSGSIPAATFTRIRGTAHTEYSEAGSEKPQHTGAADKRSDDAPQKGEDDDDTKNDEGANTTAQPTGATVEEEEEGEGKPPKRDRAAEHRKMLRTFDMDSDNEESEPTPPDNEVFVKYQNVYFDLEDKDEVLFTRTSYSPIQSADIDLDQSKAIFDVVAHFQSAIHVSRYDIHRTRGRGRMLPYPPPVYGQPVYKINIRSQTIIRALRKVVTYYPGLDLSLPSITIREPFGPIAHHYDELRAYLKEHGRQGFDVADEDTTRISEHLERFLVFADERVMPVFLEELERHARGLVTWKMLWALFKPGSDVTVQGTSSTQRYGIVNRSGSVVERVEYKESKWDRETPPEIGIKLWCLRFDGYKLGRYSRQVDITPFDGELELSKLTVVPLKHVSHLVNCADLQRHLETQGRRFVTMLKPSNFHHSGEVMESPFHRTEGQVMVDPTVFLNEFPGDRPDLMQDYQVEGDGKFSRYNNILPEEFDDLDKHMFFLCPQVVWCYVFKLRIWQPVDVSNLSSPQFDHHMIDTLVMDPKRITLLKSLSKSFMRQDMKDASQHSEPWSADYVKNKGNSQIFLLHGRPGVGKTYTAECISEYACRPLMTLSTSDIGTTPSEVEDNLQHHFKRAKGWGAILLIDEADVYLERRSTEDLTRNGLVAGFLRALEYYEGILFLTTNRVGAFDDAFVSRIHVKLHYPALSDNDRLRIWTNFIKKLETDRGDKMRVLREVRRYIESDEIKQLNLNGREIRNIFQTAVGLAEFECHKDEEGKIKMEEDHIAQVAEMSGEFKQYLDATLQGDEDKRAERLYLRTSETPPSKASRKDR